MANPAGHDTLREVDLDRFFRPETVAVIGASDTPGRPTTLNWGRIRAWAERAGARVYPVNPNKETVDGIPSLPSVLDVPDELDLAVILVADAMGALEQVIAKKARFAVLFAAGFSESGQEGEERQRRLEELLATGGVRLLGPNTNLNAFESFRDDLPGRPIALITQSGHQGRPVFQGQEIGIRFSHWAPTGNEADLESADFIRYFADRPGTGAIAAYIEGFKDGRTFQLAADHAARRGVPIVAVKVGRTDVGRSWAKSHTGHLTGADAVVSAVMRQYGVTRVDGLDELLDTAAMLARSAPPRGDGVCVYSISGGTSAHMADLLTAAGLRLPELTPDTQVALREWIPGYLRINNPVDNGGHPTGDWRGRRILDTIVADPNVDVLVVPITGAFPPMSDKLVDDLIAVAATTDKPVCVVWGSPAGTEPAYRDALLGSSLPVFRTFGNCVTAVRAFFEYHAFARRYRSGWGGSMDLGTSPGAGAARALLVPGAVLPEHRSKELLSAYGIRTSRDILCTSATEAVAAASSLGYPVVLKVAGAELPHKTDLGLVQVGVGSGREVREVYARMVERAAAATSTPIDGVLVCEQVSGGVETVVGIATDELFGPTVMFGIGGVSVEVYRDVTFRVPPFDRDEALRMVREVRGLPLLLGSRGRPAADLDAVVDVVMRVQQLARDLSGELAELDINPLVALPDGAVALDALATAR
ncbi:acetate--CoA ligase family protein [Dactylosporangium sucinum]|uniref:CoA-binding protein n=1 Tax=Dactylosporangium sucinum TaxID=1424081 RepID=A0A917WY62_9ACTN|nr:acetate--CoA ligase family protein [Dactylosporangium sucinum]GGM38936.1 CoA-binding protein [Dactylosporangium sucinum]